MFLVYDIYAISLILAKPVQLVYCGVPGVEMDSGLG